MKRNNNNKLKFNINNYIMSFYFIYYLLINFNFNFYDDYYYLINYIIFKYDLLNYYIKKLY